MKMASRMYQVTKRITKNGLLALALHSKIDLIKTFKSLPDFSGGFFCV
jgi:hypothetical protein